MRSATWTCPGCGRRYVMGCPTCPQCQINRPNAEASTETAGNGPRSNAPPDQDVLPLAAAERSVAATPERAEVARSRPKLLWAGVAAVIVLGYGWRAGWYRPQPPMEAVQVVADGPQPGPTVWISVYGTRLPIPVGWTVKDTTIDYNPIRVDAADATTVQHLQERPVAGGGFVAWGPGATGTLYWQAERPLGNGTNAIVVAIP